MNPPIEIDAAIVSRSVDITTLTFADNPQPRCPVVLLLDCSWSMEGQPIRELESAVGQFYQELAGDPIASMSIEVCIITFGTSVHPIRRFKSIADTRSEKLPHLHAGGMPPMGHAISLGLDEIQARRDFYRRNGLSAFKPWMILFTDGQPTDDWQTPSSRARVLAARDELMFLGVGIGSSSDMQALRCIVPANPGAHALRGLAFRNFFRWLADSLRIVSTGSTVRQQSIPDPQDYDWKL